MFNLDRISSLRRGSAAARLAAPVALASAALIAPAAFVGQADQKKSTSQQAQQAQEAREIEVIAENLEFKPSRIEAKPGEKLRIKLVNRGDAPHNIEFELPSGERELDSNVSMGQSATLEITAPDEPGEYTIYCPVDDHREQGMTGTLVVQEGRSPQQQPGGEEAIIVQGEWKGPESALHDEHSDVYLISNVNGDTSAKDGNGFISRVSPDGEVGELRWIDGAAEGVTLHAPKGMAIHGDTLYIADIDAVRLFDRSSGTPKGEWAVPGATFLNDIAASEDGEIFAADTAVRFTDTGAESSGEAAIYRFGADGTARVIASGDELNRPNGIVAADGRIFFVTFGGREVMWLDDTGGKVERVARLRQGRLDGIAHLENNVLLVSSWDGKGVYRIEGPAGARDGEGAKAVVQDVNSPADFGIDARRERIILPLLLEDEVRIVPLR